MGVRNVSRTVRSATVIAGPGCVAAAATLVRRYLRRTMLPPAAAARLAIVVEELICNLDEYAGLPPGAPIGLRLQRRPAGTAITLTDAGLPFDPRTAPLPGELPPERGGGAGLALVRAWTRIDGYVRDGDHNVLRLSLPDQPDTGA